MTSYLPRQAFGVKQLRQRNAVTFFAASFNAASVTVTLPALGRSIVITMSKVGDDRGTPDAAGETHAFWHGSGTFTGLGHFTEYSYTATQGSNTLSGKCRTLPGDKDNLRLFLTSCFYPSPTGELGGNPDQVAGAWNYIRQQIESGPLPVVDVVHADDICYADRFIKPSDSGVGKTTTGLPEVTLKQYDYALCYAATFGLVSPDIAGGAFPFLDSDYLFGIANCGLRYQDGDHEYTNDLQPGNAPTPNPYHATPGDYNGAGLQVFNALIRPFIGTSARSADVNAHHWYQDYGPMRLIVTDPTCNYSLNLAVPANTVMWGNNQIADLRAAWHVAHKPFKLVFNPLFGLRQPATEPDYKDGTSGFGTPDEYDNLYRVTTSNSLMQSPYTNGSAGIAVVARGDWHRSAVCTFKQPASAGLAAEALTEVNIGAVTGSILRIAMTRAPGVTEDDVFFEHMSQESGGHSYYNVLQVDVYGAESPPRMVLSLIRSPRIFFPGGNYSWSVAWTRSYTLWQTNNLGEDPRTWQVATPNTLAGVGSRRLRR